MTLALLVWSVLATTILTTWQLGDHAVGDDNDVYVDEEEEETDDGDDDDDRNDILCFGDIEMTGGTEHQSC